MSSDAESAAIEAVVRSRLSVVQDTSASVVSACSAWIGVYSSVAPTVITKVWSNLMSDTNSDTEQRIGLLAVVHESLKNCARRGGSDEVIRKFILSARRDVPPAINTALSLEPENSEFKRAVYQALTLWRNFTGFFPSQWLEKTIGSVVTSYAVQRSGVAASNLLSTAIDSAIAGGNDALMNNSASNSGQQQGSNNATSSSSAVDPVAAESSGLADVLRMFQKYSSALERLRRYEADTTASARTIESVRDDVIHRAQPLLRKLGVSGGAEGFIPTIEAEVKRVQLQQQQQQQGGATMVTANNNNSASGEDGNEDAAADPLEDFFS